MKYIIRRLYDINLEHKHRQSVLHTIIFKLMNASQIQLQIEAFLTILYALRRL